MTLPSPSPPDLCITVLGPVRARRAGEEIALGGRRQRAVLARLALAEGDVVPAERLVDDIWSGDPPRSAANTLQSYVSNLRRVLGDGASPVVERSGDGYRIDLAHAELASVVFARAVRDASRPGATSAVELDALDRALDLWDGPALGDLADEPWARGAVARLEELRLAGIEARIELRLAAGQHGLVIGDLEAAVAAHPLRERLTSQLVLALYRSGRQAEALRAFERARSHLAEELGLDPGPELARLGARVLAQDPSLDLPPTPTPTPLAPEVATPVHAGTETARRAGPLPGGQLALPPAVAERRARSPFVGRATDVATLAGELAALRDGGRRLAVVSGEAGTGKTRLVQHVARRAHEQGWQVVWGRCTAETLAPYQPFIEGLRTAVGAMGEVAAREVLVGRPALVRLVPDLVPELADVARRADLSTLYEAVAELTAEVSGGDHPLLLVVDDLQWADGSTLGLLDHVLGPDRPGRVLVLTTVRRPAGRPTDQLDGLLARCRRAGVLCEVALGGIDVEAVDELLAHRGHAVDRATAERLREQTGGNPFFLEALADHGGASVADARDLPASVRDVLDGRLASLDAGTAVTLTAAAVIGQRVDIGLLGAVVDKDPVALLDDLDVAIAGGLLTEDEDLGWVTFPHALVRQALIARTTRNREAHLHLRVADALAGAERPSTPGERAEHLLAAGRLAPLARRARAALDAGRSAVAALADVEAQRWVDRALAALDAEPDAEHALRAEALTLAAQVARHLGQRERAAQAVHGAVEVARRTDDAVLLAHAAQEQALLEAGVGLAYGAVDEGLIALLDEPLGRLPEGHDAERAALLAWGSIARDGHDPERQPRMAAEALRLAERLPDEHHLRALALFARRIAVAGPDGLDERLRLGPQMASAAQGWGEMEVIGLVLHVTGLLEADRVPEAEATLAQLRALVDARDRPASRAYLVFLDASLALLRGALDDAARLSDEALAVGQEAHGTNALHMWSAQQVQLARERGALAGLTDLAAARVEEYPRISTWRAVLAWSRAAAGDHDGARAAYLPLFDGGAWASREDTSLWYITSYAVAEAAAAASDVQACTALVAALSPFRHRMATTGMGSGCLGPLGRALGLAQLVVGDVDGALTSLDHAASRAAAAGFAPWEARALADRAGALDRRGLPGDHEEAVAARARAVEIADRLGLELALDGRTGPGSPRADADTGRVHA